MRQLLLASLIFALPGGLSAQFTPALRMSQEEVRAAAQRIDEAAMSLGQHNWLRSTPPPRPLPMQLPSQTDDATFLRRVSLDLQARLPQAKAFRAFLADPDPAKRMKLVDTQLLDPASSDRRFIRLADMLRVKESTLGVSLQPYIEWLRQACATAMPYDQMVREMITATGEVDTNPATGWLLGDGGHMTVAFSEALRVFLDEDIACARCHDNPFAAWTQRQFYELAACFGGSQIVKISPQAVTTLWPSESWDDSTDQPLAAGDRLAILDKQQNFSVRLPSRYDYNDGKPGDAVKPALWDWNGDEVGRFRALDTVKQEKLREFVADWMIDSHRFAMVAAMRTWHELFGSPALDAEQQRLLVYGDARTRAQRIKSSSCEVAGSRSVPSSSDGEAIIGALLEARNGKENQRFIETLGQELVRVNYDLREFERILCYTAAYQRECVTENLAWNFQPGAPVLRRLRPETIWNNLVLVQTDGARRADLLLSHQLPQVPVNDHPSRVLGRGAREWGDDSLPFITHSIVRLMMNGAPTEQASKLDSPLVQRLRTMQPPDVAVDEAFLTVLGRLPSHDEKLNALDHGIAHPATVWCDLVWALLNTGEFLFQR